MSNTAAEAKTVARLADDHPALADGPLLLVTSAYHMRRAQWLFAQAGQDGQDGVPFPVDFQVSTGDRFTLIDLTPNAASLWKTAHKSVVSGCEW